MASGFDDPGGGLPPEETSGNEDMSPMVPGSGQRMDSSSLEKQHGLLTSLGHLSTMKEKISKYDYMNGLGASPILKMSQDQAVTFTPGTSTGAIKKTTISKGVDVSKGGGFCSSIRGQSKVSIEVDDLDRYGKVSNKENGNAEDDQDEDNEGNGAHGTEIQNGDTNSPESVNDRNWSQVTSGVNKGNLENCLVGTLQGIPNNRVTSLDMSELEIANLLVRKMKIPPEHIVGYCDNQKPFFKIHIIPAVDASRYKTTSAIMIRDNLKLLPMMEPTREVEVEVKWTFYNTPDKDVVDTLSLFGEVMSIRHATMSQEVDGQRYQVLEACKHIKKGMRVVKMIIHTPIPSYVMISNRRSKIFYSGQIKYCSRCYKPAMGKDRCKGKANASDCESKFEGGKVDFRDFWDKLVGDLKKGGEKIRELKMIQLKKTVLPWRYQI